MISKACEPCRRRKIRCDGKTVCNGCQKNPSACVYRLKARIRARHSTSNRGIPPQQANSVGSSSGVVNTLHSPTLAETDIANAALCRHVTATHQSPQHTDSLQLFYGPASSFAFLQHIHRAIWRHEILDSDGRSLEGGLDNFMTRDVFFGIPSRISLQTIPTRDAIDEIIARPDALKLLEKFKASSLHMFPFFSPAGLNGLLDRVYGPTSNLSHPSQDMALLLVILAIGSLSTIETNEAERLLQHAKRQAEAYDDAVTMSMIQFSLLMADYHINMGRPNAAYLHISAACRKTYALGLHRLSTHATLSEQDVQERRTSLWTVYCYDRQVTILSSSRVL